MQKLSAFERSVVYPYDAPDGEGFVVEGDWAIRTARAVLDELCDRQGIDAALFSVDTDTRREIVESLADIIRTGECVFKCTHS